MLLLIFGSWIIRGIIWRKFDFIFLVILLLYKFIGNLNPTEVLKIYGVKRVKIIILLLYALGITSIAFIVCSWILPKIMNIDVNKFTQLKSDFKIVELMSKKYPKIIIMMEILNFHIYGTFFEEFIFRGLILRRLLKYNFYVANII
ncbi:MAG: hypothetical protein ACP5IV_07690 [Caldisericia bacterium]